MSYPHCLIKLPIIHYFASFCLRYMVLIYNTMQVLKIYFTDKEVQTQESQKFTEFITI